MQLRLLIAAALLALAQAAQAATQVLPLHYRASEDLLPVAESFLGRDGTVSAYGNQLIVNAEPEKIEELSALLDQLDKPARRLLISVDSVDSHSSGANGYNADGSSRQHVIHYGTGNRSGGLQQIQTSEGTPALIQVGESVPLTSTQIDAYGDPQSQTQYRDVTRGFFVTASVTGDTVHLKISANNDRMSQERPDVIQMQSADSQLSAKLGQWVTLAGTQEQSQSMREGYAQRYSTQGRNDMTLRVKVDVLD